MAQVEIRVVTQQEADQRLDRWFRAHFPDLPFARLAKLLREGQVRVDGKRAKAGLRLAAGQRVRIPPLETGGARPARPGGAEAAPASPAEAERLRESVLYRDDWVIALDKPAGLAVQGGSGQRRHLDAMLSALAFGSAERPRLVHRLDRDTAGVLLLARSREAARRLTASFKGDAPRKLYWALVRGVPHPRRGRIELALGKEGGPGAEKMVAGGDGARPATTLYAVVAVEEGGGSAWLALRPLTGRTHQLRAHAAAMGHPILGDGKYGGRAAFPKVPGLPSQLMLLAREIALPHPEDGTTLRVTAPLPPHMLRAFATLGFDPENRAADGAAAALLES